MFNLEKIVEKLKKEASSIEYELKVELPKEIGEAIAQGDLSENAEYESAKERQSTLMGRLSQINRRIEEVSRIDLSQIPRDRVSLGSTVFTTNLETEEITKYIIVPPEAMDGQANHISIMSPIARCLVGGFPGDEILVEIPRGEFELRIDRVVTYYGDILE